MQETRTVTSGQAGMTVVYNIDRWSRGLHAQSWLQLAEVSLLWSRGGVGVRGQLERCLQDNLEI